MTNDQLLLSRIKVIAPYPFSPYEVGDIFTFVCDPWGGSEGQVWSDENGKEVLFKHFNDYPHLFQPLPWYAERKIEDLPEYVKTSKHVFRHEYKSGGSSSTIVYNQWLGDETKEENSTGWLFVTNNNFKGLEPATIEDYNNYLKTLYNTHE